MCFAGLLGLVTGVPLLLLLPALRVYRLLIYVPTSLHLLVSAVVATPAILNLIAFVWLTG